MSDQDKLEVEPVFSAGQWHEIANLEPLVRQAARAAYEMVRENLIETGPHIVAINLSDDATIRDLNHSFRGKDKATNVLSFPFDDDFPELNPGAKPLGDIILAFETIALEAEQQNKQLGHHVAHLVVHGVLHLCGYDHIDETEAEEMEGLECDILATLEIPSPYRSR